MSVPRLVLSALLLSAPLLAATAPEHDDHDHGHSHGHEHHAPHHGTLIALGEELAHLELVLDPERGELRAYSLDGEAEHAVPLKQTELRLRVVKPAVELKLVAQANELTGEKPGQSSEFVGSNPLLKNLKEFDASLVQIDIVGQNFQNVRFKFPQGNEAP